MQVHSHEPNAGEPQEAQPGGDLSHEELEAAVQALSISAWNLQSGGGTGVGGLQVGPDGGSVNRLWRPGSIKEELAVIVDLCSYKEKRRSIVYCGGVEALVQAILASKQDADDSLSALVSLSMCKDVRIEMYHRLHAVQATLLSLMVSATNTKTRGLFVNVFRNLSDTGGADNRAAMFKGGVAEALVSVINLEDRRDTDCVNSALNCLTNLASNTANRVPMLRADGVVATLVDVINESDVNTRPLRNALVTLTNLSCHKDNRVPMMKMGVADLLVTLTLTASPDSKHLEAVLIMIVNLSAMEACRVPLVEIGAVDAALAVIRSCPPGTKNCEIALKIVQNLSAHADTGKRLIEAGALQQALESARSSEPKISAVAAGILSNLALFGKESGTDVREQMLEAGVTSALQSLLDRPERTGLSAAKAAAYLFGGEESAGAGPRDHPLLKACGPALGRLCNALQHTLDGKELYGVTFDVFELVLAIKDVCVIRENLSALVQAGGIPTLLRAVREQAHDARCVLMAIKTLALLAEDDGVAAKICEHKNSLATLELVGQGVAVGGGEGGVPDERRACAEAASLLVKVLRRHA